MKFRSRLLYIAFPVKVLITTKIKSSLWQENTMIMPAIFLVCKIFRNYYSTLARIKYEVWFLLTRINDSERYLFSFGRKMIANTKAMKSPTAINKFGRRTGNRPNNPSKNNNNLISVAKDYNSLRHRSVNINISVLTTPYWFQHCYCQSMQC